MAPLRITGTFAESSTNNFPGDCYIITKKMWFHLISVSDFAIAQMSNLYFDFISKY